MQLIPYLNPIIKQFVLVDESHNVDSIADSTASEKSYANVIIQQMKIRGISTFSVKQLEPFIDSQYSKEVYEFFRSDKSMRKKCMLKILETVVFLYNYMHDCKLEDYHIEEIKVS